MPSGLTIVCTYKRTGGVCRLGMLLPDQQKHSLGDTPTCDFKKTKYDTYNIFMYEGMLQQTR